MAEQVAAAAALPAGWTEHKDEKSGATYYWNAASGATSWERPAADAASNPSHAQFLKRKAPEASAAGEYMKLLMTQKDGASSKQHATSWVKHSDPNSGVPYFVNTETNETTWDPPAGGFVDATAKAGPAAAAANPYGQSATFNKATGRFEMADGANYWDSVGRPRDRDGRMMDAYFDVNTLDANRKEAERMKKKHKKYDWRKYKEAKKKEKMKRRVQALLTD
mmetsp:Transcript_22842/g.68582  ORF Transcript_22842/g.68582 Transcript_22842/m.68582 type:complete len:222 (+) Transcript_22842:156-821(+)|eukprot:CAMPEP_0119267418 /NCGR_PEP_ID=MMETSP1329-20130426/5561_1 /TAXON_ID=114041 /ORGANISM="Genus nov. species nov., Strain RCC1024" /LENGTH=221 /DNA_ID=CAMNT_0007267341 /DNA_START=137 /DNA_END=802 /DNA_ORIENTATION=-